MSESELSLVEAITSADVPNEPLPNEGLLLLVLAAVQFTNLLDFVIIMPLGPQFMRVFSIGPRQFGLIVSSYTFSAGVSGFISAFFIDRFDRKAALLALYGGFMVGTGLCALAPSYFFLVSARVLAGAFGGVLSSLVLAIIGDVVPYGRRGAAMGVVMSAFSLATVAGVPIGLYIATQLGWHATFSVLAGTSALILVIASRVVPSLRAHVGASFKGRPLHMIRVIMLNPNHLRAFSFTAMLMFAGFSVIPFLSPYLVYNVGLKESDLTYTYCLGGLFTLFTSRIIGKLADGFGKKRVFAVVALLSIAPIIIITNLPPIPLPWVLFYSTLFFILVSGRNVPAFAMITASVRPENRGSFMSFNSSVQQMSAGVASFLAGLVIQTSPTGAMTGYAWVGTVAGIATIFCLFLSNRLVQIDGGGHGLEHP